MLRPAQLTLGSLVPSLMSRRAPFPNCYGFCRTHAVTPWSCRKAFSYDKLNYLMLMMVDPDVHFHIIPRYATSRYFEGIEFRDPAWPGAPDLGRINETNAEINRHIMNHLANRRQD